VTAAFPSVAYLVASFLFILSLKGLSQPATARRGNVLGSVGMALAIVVTALALYIPGSGAPAIPSPSTAMLLAGAIGIGCLIGAVLAARVAMQLDDVHGAVTGRWSARRPPPEPGR